MLEYDYLIVGAGFSGLVLAERLSNELGASCLVVEKRRHIGGNAYDEYDDHGVLTHKYGPHYFRTNSDKVREYLSRFTEWQPAAYQILAHTGGRYWNFPINLNTFEQFIGRPASSEEMEEALEKWRVPIAEPANSEEVIISQVGWDLYRLFFEGYTLKQWQRHPRELDASVCGRIPIRTNRDDRYLREEFQALPKAGYTRMFERMLAACRKTHLMLNTEYREVVNQVKWGHLIFTGPIDEFFDHRLGRLPYRSLHFEAESFEPGQLLEREEVSRKKGFWQPALQVNYPNDQEYTRIVEVKHATGQLCENTTIVREYPRSAGDPYYPIPAPDATALYKEYQALAKATPNVSFVGRLATYKYYNMDQVVALALQTFEKLKEARAGAVA
jgi:UDP-galactopyranose mutase